MDLATLRKVALSRYGGSRFGDEDALLSYPILNDAVNQAHRWLAERCRLYRATKTANLTAGTSYVALAADVIEIAEPGNVRAYCSGTWRTLEWRSEAQLVTENGPRENAAQGDPWAFFLRAGDAAGAARVLELYPTPAATVASGLKYEAWIYPPTLTLDSDSPAFQAGEHDRLIAAVCWHLAEVELSRGRPDAPVGYWMDQADREAQALTRICRESRRPGSRRIRSCYR